MQMMRSSKWPCARMHTQTHTHMHVHTHARTCIYVRLARTVYYRILKPYFPAKYTVCGPYNIRFWPTLHIRTHAHAHTHTHTQRTSWGLVWPPTCLWNPLLRGARQNEQRTLPGLALGSSLPMVYLPGLPDPLYEVGVGCNHLLMPELS